MKKNAAKYVFETKNSYENALETAVKICASLHKKGNSVEVDCKKKETHFGNKYIISIKSWRECGD